MHFYYIEILYNKIIISINELSYDFHKEVRPLEIITRKEVM